MMGAKNKSILIKSVSFPLIITLLTLCFEAFPKIIFDVKASESKIFKKHSPKKREIKNSSRKRNHPYVRDEILVRFKESSSSDSINNSIKSFKGIAEKIYKTNKIVKIKIPRGERVKDVIKRLEKDPNTLYAEPNYLYNFDIVPNEPDFNLFYNLNNTGQLGGTIDADIDAPEAWNFTTGTQDVVVAVIDSGVDYNHADLSQNIWKNPGEIPNNGIDDDNNGFVDDLYGWDFGTNDNDPMDTANHGTHVAGIIGAIGNNSIGTVGINWNVKLMLLKVADAYNQVPVSAVIDALEYAISNGARIANNSYGGLPYSQALRDTIQQADGAGILFIASAGNFGIDNDLSPYYPASYDLPNIIAVAATDKNDLLASFSNYGTTSVDLGAPGKSIYSTLPGNTYNYKSGTSMAAAHVSGVSGLLYAMIPDLDHNNAKNFILNSVNQVSSLSGKCLTGGRLNAWNTLQNANNSLSKIEINSNVSLRGIASWDNIGKILSGNITIINNSSDKTLHNLDAVVTWLSNGNVTVANPDGYKNGNPYWYYGDIESRGGSGIKNWQFRVPDSMNFDFQIRLYAR